MAEQDPYKAVQLALVIDNEVVEVLQGTERFGAIMLSNPTIVDITGKWPSADRSIDVGSIYDPKKGTFTNPDATAKPADFDPNAVQQG